MELTAKWTANGIQKYDDSLNLFVVKDESGNGNDAFAVNICKVYDNVIEIRDDGDDIRSIGIKGSFTERGYSLDGALEYLGFNGHSFMRVKNSDYINLDTFTIKISFMFASRAINSQYIFDKRNGQWHRNYCLLFAGSDFPHLRPEMKDGNFMLFDLGDGREMKDDFDNGLTVAISEPNVAAIQRVIISYSNNNICINVNGTNINDRVMNMLDIRGEGDLIIGDAAWPHSRGAWPVWGDHPFYGCIESLEIYSGVDESIFKEEG